MKTRERILLCSLELFNEQGEPNVTTLDIANELDISPGNLYYHFHGKDALVEELLLQFQEHTRDLLSPHNQPKLLHPEDYWLFLHLLFEAISHYRFLFQDLSNLMGRHAFVQRAMQSWLNALRGSLKQILAGLREQGHVHSDDQGMECLLDSLCQTFLFWLDYQRITGQEQPGPAQAVQQIMGMMLPYLDDDSRDWMQSLIAQYH